MSKKLHEFYDSLYSEKDDQVCISSKTYHFHLYRFVNIFNGLSYICIRIILNDSLHTDSLTDFLWKDSFVKVRILLLYIKK